MLDLVIKTCNGVPESVGNRRTLGKSITRQRQPVEFRGPQHFVLRRFITPLYPRPLFSSHFVFYFPSCFTPFFTALILYSLFLFRWTSFFIPLPVPLLLSFSFRSTLSPQLDCSSLFSATFLLCLVLLATLFILLLPGSNTYPLRPVPTKSTGGVYVRLYTAGFKWSWMMPWNIYELCARRTRPFRTSVKQWLPESILNAPESSSCFIRWFLVNQRLLIGFWCNSPFTVMYTNFSAAPGKLKRVVERGV